MSILRWIPLQTQSRRSRLMDTIILIVKACNLGWACRREAKGSVRSLPTAGGGVQRVGLPLLMLVVEDQELEILKLDCVVQFAHGKRGSRRVSVGS